MLCLVNLRGLHSCTLYLQVTRCRLDLKTKEQEGSRGGYHMNGVGSLQPPLSCYNLSQTLPTQSWCSTSPHEGFKALTWGCHQLSIVFAFRNAHTIWFSMIWIPSRGKTWNTHWSAHKSTQQYAKGFHSDQPNLFHLPLKELHDQCKTNTATSFFFFP